MLPRSGQGQGLGKSGPQLALTNNLQVRERSREGCACHLVQVRQRHAPCHVGELRHQQAVEISVVVQNDASSACKVWKAQRLERNHRVDVYLVKPSSNTAQIAQIYEQNKKERNHRIDVHMLHMRVHAKTSVIVSDNTSCNIHQCQHTRPLHETN